MKKNILLLGVLSIVFAGCVENRAQVDKEELRVESTVVEQPIIVEQPVVEKKIVSKRKIKEVSYTYYRIVPSKIEVFQYRLGNNTIIDDKKLNNSFYLTGDKIRIEKIYTSKIGDKYGKIAAKNLIVSMDDLTK